HAAHFLACLPRPPGAPAGAREIDARLGKVGRAGDHALERREALLDLVLVEERNPEEPEAIHLARYLGLERAQPDFRGRRIARAQRRVRRAAPRLECGPCLRCAHDPWCPETAVCPGGERSGYTSPPLSIGLAPTERVTVHAKRPLLIPAALLACLAPLAGQARALTPEDWFRFQDVSDLRIAPDGSAVAYLVTSYDKSSDESRSALWTVAWNGRDNLELTRGESVSEPRFSPDGRYLSFLSARPAGSTTQLFVLDRRGGEPRQVSHVSGEITGYEWSPDGQRVVLVMHAEEDTKPPKPLVIDAFRFKEDRKGYLTTASRTHLYLLDVRTGASEALTTDANRADSLPVFSPDGRPSAYVSNAVAAARAAAKDEVRIVAAAAGSQPRALLSTWSPNRQRLAWSPDGTLLAFLQGDELKYNAYIMDRLAVAE